MKQLSGWMLVLCSAVPAMASEPADFSRWGLGDLQVVSDQQGESIRGEASRAYSMSVASISALIYDPATGSQTNIDLAHFSNSEATGTAGNPSTAATEGALGLTGFDIEVGTFKASIGQSAVFVGGQSGAGRAGSFTFQSLNVPRFR